MVSSKLKRGDLVRLKSGSPVMLVTAEENHQGMVSVVLWDKDSKTGLRGLTFKSAYLGVVSGPL